ncbi:hypothetical protein [Peptoniphilus sp.]|uniref:hypothetical protein n=1 Tax=Peptoniphilus sp. TaxID=1971214 RepID=UPI0039910BDE
MNKKFLSLVLALVMVLGTLTPVFAEEAPKDKIEKAAKTAPSAKVQWLVDEKIVSGRKLFKDGDEKTELSLDKNLQRDEVTRLLVLGKGLENLANLVQGTMRPYVDVDNANWANGVITVGSYHLKNKQGVPMLAGYPGNKFLPTRNVTFAELAKMLVTLVDDSITPAMVKNFQWPSDWMVRAARLGILAGVEVKDSSAFVTRQAAFEMLYNAMYLYDTRHNVDYGTKMGVVSGYANGELKINQGEKAFTVKLNASTLYVNNSGYVGNNALQMWNGNQGLWIGSLVRVITDAEGNATHIVELGNPSVGAIEGRWFGVADKTVQGYADFKDADGKSTSKLTVYNGTWLDTAKLQKFLGLSDQMKKNQAFQDINGKPSMTVNLTSSTRYFVADANRNYLTEVDNATARNLVNKAFYGNEIGAFANVYVGYDELAKGITGRETNEARVVVFNVVDKTMKDEALVRVTNPSNGMYNLYAENTKGEVAEYSLRKYAGSMPGFERPNGLDSTNKAGYRGQFEKFNVLSLDLNKETKEIYRSGLVIDYATAPSFKVVETRYDHGKLSLITLEGKNGVRIPDVRVDLEKVDIFTEGQWNERDLVGKYIQITSENLGKEKDVDGYFIKDFVINDVISVLDHPQNLAMINAKYGQNELNVKVEINAKAEEYADGRWRVAVENVKFLAEGDNHAQMNVPGTFMYYYVSKEDAKMLNDTLDARTDKTKPVTFKASVIKLNLVGSEYQLDLKEEVK